MKNIPLLFVLLALASCTKEKKQIFLHAEPTDGYSVSRKIIGLIYGRADNPYLAFVESTNACISFYSTTSVAAQRAQINEQAGTVVTAVDSKGEDIVQTFSIADIVFNYINQAVGYKTDYPQTQQTTKNLSDKLLSLYGKEVTFKSNKESSLLMSEKLYIPKYLKLTDTFLKEMPEKISGGTSFTWNADNLNKNGVVIRITAELPEKKEIIENISFTDDDGAYSLEAELLEGIPVGVNVMVEVIRGNLQIAIDSNGNSYKIYAYSGCSHIFIK